MNSNDKASEILSEESFSFYVAQGEKGVQYRYRGTPNDLLEIFIALAETIMNEAEKKGHDKEDVITALRESLENTIYLHDWVKKWQKQEN